VERDHSHHCARQPRLAGARREARVAQPRSRTPAAAVRGCPGGYLGADPGRMDRRPLPAAAGQSAAETQRATSA
jgi:hypothetical protein